jgi:hypothetical protein
VRVQFQADFCQAITDRIPDLPGLLVSRARRCGMRARSSSMVIS